MAKIYIKTKGDNMENNKEKFLVIDGNSIMNRAFYGIRLLSTADGLFTNAVYGFLNIYYMMLDKINPDYVAVAFDLKAPTFRHKMYSEYKAHRKMMPDELRVQMPLIKEVLSAMNVPIFEIEGFEADDVLGTISKKNTNLT
jgi:DNA polymerase-1